MNIVADGLMALFLFFIGKELWEALTLEQGALKGRQAVLPAGLTPLGGCSARGSPGWLVGQALIETAEEAGFATGWQVPLGSDVVLSYLIGRARSLVAAIRRCTCCFSFSPSRPTSWRS